VRPSRVTGFLLSIIEIYAFFWHGSLCRRAMRHRVWGITMTMNLPWSGYAAVDAVRKAVEIDSNWDSAESTDKLHFYILRAAQNVERFEPFSEDETALNKYLESRMAGKRLCDYAWRMFKQG